MRYGEFFHVAHELGMTFEEYTAKVSHREHRTWLEWFALEMNRPNRSDHYLMQIAAEVIRCHVKDPGSISINDFKIEWRPKKSEEEEKRSAVNRSQANWLAAMGSEIKTEKLPKSMW